MADAETAVKSKDERSHRLYNCRRCGKLVTLCRRCDRGNLYCFDGCAQLQRAESLRRARLKYQRSEKGRLNHKVAQQRYRARLDERGAQAKVMDHGSPHAGGQLARRPAQATEPGRKDFEYENPNDKQPPQQQLRPRCGPRYTQQGKPCCHGCGIRLPGRSRRHSLAEDRRWRRDRRVELPR